MHYKASQTISIYQCYVVFNSNLTVTGMLLVHNCTRVTKVGSKIVQEGFFLVRSENKISVLRFL